MANGRDSRQYDTVKGHGASATDWGGLKSASLSQAISIVINKDIQTNSQDCSEN